MFNTDLMKKLTPQQPYGGHICTGERAFHAGGHSECRGSQPESAWSIRGIVRWPLLAVRVRGVREWRSWRYDGKREWDQGLASILTGSLCLNMGNEANILSHKQLA